MYITHIYRQLIIFIPLVYILVSGLGIGVLGAWSAYPISDIISFVTAAIFIKHTYASLEKLETRQVAKRNRPRIRRANYNIGNVKQA